MDLTYQQILAEQYDENAKMLLVQQMNDYEDEDVDGYNAREYEDNDISDKEEFNKFHGDRNKPEHVIKPKADPDTKHRDKIRVKTQVVNIDSKFRGNIVPNPNAKTTLCDGSVVSNEISLISGTSSSYFIYYPDRPYKNVKSIKITSLEFPNTFYTFSASRGNISFTTQPSGLFGLTTWTIPDGNYTIQQLVIKFNDLFTAAGRSFQFSYDPNSHKVSLSGPGSDFSFNFSISTSGPNGNGIGYNLGFLQSVYDVTTPSPTRVYNTGTNTTTFTAELIPDVIQDTYVYVVINDYNLINHPIYGQTTIQAYGKITLQVAKNAIVFDNNFTNSSSKIYYFQQPTNVTKFEIKFIDAYGNILNLNGGHVSITLELDEVLDSGIYENMLQL